MPQGCLVGCSSFSTSLFRLRDSVSALRCGLELLERAVAKGAAVLGTCPTTPWLGMLNVWTQPKRALGVLTL